ncbi:protein kinase [Micromonospora sp. WMMD1102]|uniref:serine/threonine-protein kinase n=1 Tax=Micromonospora sp. WMMD1102 TaxID=3016105 RepID=UPI00241557A9|nr:protein kinase [Micromonospora sp. WMMD1102]MDG4791274.1 protein kinase [Micromonospora sp. WMMD1102]
MPGLTDLQVFARGGYATVYRATQQSVGREVAVKVENRTLDSERDQRRFLREARAAGRMSSHPHVVDLFDAGVTEDQHPYLIMELCDGSYAERMRTSPLDPAEARDVGVKIADALADAHQLGVLHRDVKPANILYSRFNEPALADFGLAVLAEARDSAITLEVLTPAYAPPEMFRHSPPSPAVDVYALCATLYAVMSGKPPRWQADRNPGLLALLELFTEPIPELPGVPGRFLDLLRYGMANDPADRPSAEQLRDLLAAVPLDPPTVVNTPKSGVVAAVPVSGIPVSGIPVSGIPVSGGSWPPGALRDQSGAGASGGGVSSGAGVGAAAGSTSTPSPRMPVSGVPVSGVPVSGVPVSGSPVSGSPVSGSPVSGASTSGGAPPSVYLSRSYTPPPPRPGSGPPEVDGEPTVSRPSRRKRRYWIFGGLGALALVATMAGGSWYVATRGGPGPSPSGRALPSTAGPTAGRPTAGIGALPGCQLPLPEVARCPVELECFGPVRLRGTAAEASETSCAGRHTWESYAEGDLPYGLDPADHAAVKDDGTVRQVCNATVFRRTTTLIDTAAWKFEVLPPTAGEAGRTFRCLAGKGVDRLTGPTLTAN